MAPNGFYSSSIDGSLYIASAKNSARHGNGSALIEDVAFFFFRGNYYPGNSWIIFTRYYPICTQYYSVIPR